MALTPKQQRFVDEYLVDLNATQAAIRAGYSARAAHSTGPRMLENAGVQAAITEGKKKLSESAKVTAERVIEEYARIAFLDTAKAFRSDGQLLPIHEMPEDVRRAIGGMEIAVTGAGEGSETVKKIKLIDKKGALDSLARHLGLFNDSLKIGGENPLVVFIEDVRKRNRPLVQEAN